MRLFVAIELGDDVRRVLQRAQRALGGFDRMVRWVGDAQVHLTLKFLGDVPDGRVDEIRDVLEAAAAASEAFAM